MESRKGWKTQEAWKALAERRREGWCFGNRTEADQAETIGSASREASTQYE